MWEECWWFFTRVVGAFGHWSHELVGEHGIFLMTASQIWGPSHVDRSNPAGQSKHQSQKGQVSWEAPIQRSFSLPYLTKNGSLAAEEWLSAQDSVHLSFLYQSSKKVLHADLRKSFHNYILAYFDSHITLWYTSRLKPQPVRCCGAVPPWELWVRTRLRTSEVGTRRHRGWRKKMSGAAFFVHLSPSDKCFFLLWLRFLQGILRRDCGSFFFYWVCLEVSVTGQQPSQSPSGFRFDSQTVRGVSFKPPLGDEENMFKSCGPLRSRWIIPTCS